MKTTIIKPKWIIVGFNFGIGLSLAYLLGYLLIPLAMSLVKTVLGITYLTANILVVSAIFVIVVVLLPAFAGKTIAQFINKFRDRKPMNDNRASDNGA